MWFFFILPSSDTLCFRYKTLVPDEASAKSTRVTSLMSTDEFNEIHDLYIDAAQLFPNGDIDADVQVSNFIVVTH